MHTYSYTRQAARNNEKVGVLWLAIASIQLLDSQAGQPVLLKGGTFYVSNNSIRVFSIMK